MLSDPGKPWQNGHDESFNGKFRDECLSMEWFRNRHEAMAIIETWPQHYNEVRAALEPGLLDSDRVQDGESQDNNPADRGRLSISGGPENPGRSVPLAR
ncbi:transposase [Candidatus Binatia bacterium]|nr:transposase [Candidatus Binatia bacterium]